MNTIPPRAQELIQHLRLEPHPEGGFYREVYRSPHMVHALPNLLPRSALTAIHFLLLQGNPSRWHRVHWDELWHWVEGAPLELLSMEPDFSTWSRQILAEPAPGKGLMAIVPGGNWQAATTQGDYTLVSCMVAPGFQFDDFTLLSDNAERVSLFRSLAPELADLI